MTEQGPGAADRQDGRAVRAQNAPTLVVHDLAAHGAGKRKIERRVRATILGEKTVGVAVVVGLDIEPGHAVDRLGGLVDERDASGGVGDDHAFRELTENGGMRQALGRLARRVVHGSFLGRPAGRRLSSGLAGPC